MTTTYAGRYGAAPLQLPSGAAAVGLSVEVRTTAGALATLYSDKDRGSTVSNPITSDSVGNISLYAEPGEYDLVVPGGSVRISVDKHPLEPGGAGASGVGRVLAKLISGLPIKVTFVADSGLEGNTATTPGTDDAATLFCSELGTRFGVTVTKLNRALSGSTAGFVQIPSWHSPNIFPAALGDAADLYVISFGHNDIRSDLASPGTGYPLAASAAAVASMVRRIRTQLPQADIIISGAWPYTDTAVASNTYLTPHMAQLRLVAAQYGCEYVDYAGALTAKGVGTGNATTDAIYVWPSAAPSGQHPTSAGHRVWADALLAKFSNSAVAALPAAALAADPWSSYSPLIDTLTTDWVSPAARTTPAGTPGWRQSGTWSPANGATPSTSSTAGDTISCLFDGTECYLRFDTGAGAGTITIQVDGAAVYSSLNLATQPGAGQSRLPIVGLARGIHNVLITVVSGTVTWRGMDCRTGSVPKILSPDDASITYTGSWPAFTTNPAGAWNNTTRQSTTIGDSITFTFTGTAFGLQMQRYVAVHQVSVTVDGVVTTVDVSTGSPGGQPGGVVIKQGLTAGAHTVTVASTGSRNLLVDAVFYW